MFDAPTRWEMSLLAASGALIRRGAGVGYTAGVDLRNVAPGNYLLRLASGGSGSIVRPFSVTH